jgi:hypothetical protein
MSISPSTWGKNNYRWTFGVGTLVGILLVPLVECFLLCLFDTIEWWDILLFVLAIAGLLAIGIFSYRNEWSENSWVPVALIISIVAILFVGTNYSIKKGTIPLWKISVADCEIYFQAEIQSTVQVFTTKCSWDKNKKLDIQKFLKKGSFRTCL